MDISLNLIPPYRKEAILKSKRLKLAIRIELAVFLFVLMFFAFLFGSSYTLDFSLKTAFGEAEASSEKAQYDKISGYDSKFKKINSQLEQIEKIKEDQLYWSNLFVNLSQSALPGISIENIATKDYAVFLAGKADSRDNLIAFKDRLEKKSCFSNINLPLSDLVSKGNIAFQMDLEIKRDCVHPVE